MTLAYPGVAYPGETYPGDSGGISVAVLPQYDLTVEVAFATEPDDPSPTWVDLTSRLDVAAGVSISRGRANEHDAPSPGRLSLVLDNVDGALTADRPSSPYYPNVKVSRRIRVSYVDPVTSAVSYRFDGYVDEWPTEWPGGMSTYSKAAITATDLLARIGTRRKLRSVVEETALLDHPVWYYLLGEPASSLTVGDSTTSGNAAVLHVQQVGSGGELTFASGTGPGTDGRSAPVFAPVDTSNGLRITGTVPKITYGPGGDCTLEVAFNTSTVAEQTIVRFADLYGATYMELGIDATGHLTASLYTSWNGFGNIQQITSSTIVTDGQTHHAAYTLSTPSTTTTGTLYLDGSNIGSGTYTANNAILERLTIGGTQGGRMFTGTISHVAGYAAALTSTQATEHRVSQSTGFSGERSDQRIARVATWIGLPSARMSLDVGMATVGHLDSSGMGAMDYLRRIEATESGLLYVNGAGTLVFKSRAVMYAAKTPDLVLSEPNLVGRDIRITKDLQLVVNDVTGSRPGGATQRVTNEASIDSYGVQSVSLDLMAATDTEVTDAINWRVQTTSEPVVRIPSMTLDAFTDSTKAASIRGLSLLDYVQVSGMPAQAPSSTINQIVQGFAERIDARGWDVTLNTSNYATVRVLILDDATFGTLDGANVLAY